MVYRPHISKNTPPPPPPKLEPPPVLNIFNTPSPEILYLLPPPILEPSTGGKKHENINQLKKLIIQHNYQQMKKTN